MKTLSPKLSPSSDGLEVEYPDRESYYLITDRDRTGFPEFDNPLPCAVTYYDYRGAEVYSIWAPDIYAALAMINIIVSYDIIVVDTGGGNKALGRGYSGDDDKDRWYFLLTDIKESCLPINAEPTRLWYYDSADIEITHIDGLPACKAIEHIRDFCDLLSERLI